MHQNLAERVRWCAYPSWAHFTWLYGVSLVAGVRGLLALQSGAGGWGFWLAGATGLLACAAVLRRWAQYSFTSHHVTVRNGLTGRDIQTLPFDDLAEVTVMQGPLAQWLNIGTVVLRSVDGECTIALRGVRNPLVIKARLDALRP